MRRAVVAAIVLGWLTLSLGQQKPVDTESALKPQIDRAVARAVQFLRQTQAANGSWDQMPGGQGQSGHTVGCTALAALALMEAGVPVRDPAVERAIQFIRQGVQDQSRPGRTYDVSATVWALNRFGDPDDQDLIRQLVCRLVKAQLANGLWSYECPWVSSQEVQQIMEQLRQLRAAGQMYNSTSGDPNYGQGDLSNTQFAIMALWIGRRYGVPTDPVLWKTAEVLRRSQNQDGGWGYLPAQNVGSTYSMTAAGLMGISTGYGALRETLLSTTGKGGDISAKPAAPPDPAKDPVILRGNLYLATVLRTPFDALTQQGFGSVPYTLWAIERVAMVYDWQTLGGVNWHAWGAAYFFRTQAANGAWDDNNRCGPIPCTAFGILFLKRSNLATDLTAHFRGEAVLRTGGDDKALTKPSRPGQGGDDGSATDSPAKPRRPITVAEWTESLITGSDAEKRAALEEVTRSAGGMYTLALAEAISRTNQPTEQLEFRRALVQRMTRLSVESLRTYLQHANPELRRAAAWAVALRDEQSLGPDLVRLLEDKDAEVAATAYLALRTLTGKDFGRSASAWKKYFAQLSSP
jgi:prenyltransferase beta subunit